jgi:transcriptional regulator with GAF, ATPase, and Fis domain
MKPEAERLIGQSAVIRQIDEEVDCAARSDAKVLITGESGVGKEVAARLIHQRSRRRHARLVSLNCAGLPDSLLESELFGHVRGAFTGAYRDKAGLLQLANAGTIFLDEVGEMSLRLQAVLLRFLETGEIHPVGADHASTTVDVRVIAATNRNLRERIETQEFRQDLYFRLNVIPLTMPPLRDRRADIPSLLEYFFDRCASREQVPVPRLSADALALMIEYDWPGNVRELKNFVERMVLRGAKGVIGPADLPSEIAPRPLRVRGPAKATPAELLFDRMVRGGEAFWSAVYQPFMSRDLTRADVRAVVRLGLEQARSYRALAELFNLPADDNRRLVAFLRKYECQIPAESFKDPVPARTAGAPAALPFTPRAAGGGRRGSGDPAAS